jgi:hypothetical protein
MSYKNYDSIVTYKTYEDMRNEILEKQLKETEKKLLEVEQKLLETQEKILKKDRLYIKAIVSIKSEKKINERFSRVIKKKQILLNLINQNHPNMERFQNHNDQVISDIFDDKITCDCDCTTCTVYVISKLIEQIPNYENELKQLILDDEYLEKI